MPERRSDGPSATRTAAVAAPRCGTECLARTAWIEVDLDAIVHNFELLRGALGPGVRLEPVVKGNAYGHGAVAVAQAVAAAGAESFSVATFDEAIELRSAGLRQPILVLYPIPPELVGSAARQGIAITAGDPTLLERTLAALERSMTSPSRPRRRLAVHLEVETGLGRGGFQPDDVVAAAQAIAAAPGARLAAIWSHLQSAGDRPRTSAQAERLGLARGLLDGIGIRPPRHLAASGGVLAASSPELEAVRIGLSLYGIVPDGLDVEGGHAQVAAGLRPAMSLRARPVRVTELQAGTGISYGPTFVADRQSRIATLPLGYADGYPRSLSNRAQAIVRGIRVPVVGTVAMDAIMVDVTDVPGPPVGVDDEFTLIGEQDGLAIDAREVGRWGNTISYEVVTAMSRRLARVYYAAAETVGVSTLAAEWPRRRRPSSRADA